MSTHSLARRVRLVTTRAALVAVATLLAVLSASSALGQAVRVGPTVTIDPAAARYTDVAYDPVNRVHLMVWGAFGTIKGRFISSDGTPLGSAPFQLHGATPYAAAPGVVYAADHGAFMVVWQDLRADPNFMVVYGRALTYQASGLPTFRGPEFLLSGGLNALSQPVVAYSTVSHEFIAVYQTTSARVRGTRFTIDGATLGGEVAITSSTDFEFMPAIAYNGLADEYYIIYSYWVDAANQGGVRGQRVKGGTGEILGGPLTIETLVPGQIGPTAVNHDPDRDRYLAGWYRSIPSGFVIFGRFVARDNTPLSDRFTVAGTGSYVSLGMGRNPQTGSFFAAFSHHDLPEVFGAEVTADGTAAAMIRVTDTGQIPPQPGMLGVDYPRVAATEDRPEWLVSSALLWSAAVAQRIQSGVSPSGFSKTTPVNGATGQAAALDLAWGSVAGATYEVCVDASNNSTCDAAWQSTGTATTYSLSSLANGTYYWQVRATAGGTTTFGNNGSWWSFTVGASPPPVLAKVAPTNGQSGLAASVTLTWGTAVGASEYQVCADVVNDGGCTASWVSTGLSTSYALNNLPKTTYYWQVRAQVNGSWVLADNGTEWHFTVDDAPPGFAKVSPTNGQSGLGGSVTLTWGAMAGALGYQVCADVVNDGGCTTSWVSTGLTTSYALNNLPAMTYYWQVRAQVNGSYVLADNGTEWRFTVGGTPQGFGKVSPANGATGVSSSVTLTWNAASGATEYAVCVDQGNDGNCTASWQSAGTATSFGVSGLANGVYYWQARAKVSGAWVLADLGSEWGFTVSGAPTLGKTSPANGTADLTGTVILQWTPVPDAGYVVCWDMSDNGACDGGWWPNGSGSSRTVAGLANGRYFWQVRAVTSTATTDADGGTWWSFWVGPPPPTFVDGTLQPGVTPVRAVHVTELRQAIDAARGRRGLGGFAWSDAQIAPGTTTVRAIHLTEMRVALEDVYRAAGRTLPGWSPATISPGTTVVFAAHISEIRAAVVAIW